MRLSLLFKSFRTANDAGGSSCLFGMWILVFPKGQSGGIRGSTLWNLPRLEAGGYPSLIAKHSTGKKRATSRRNDTVTSAQMFYAKSKNELESAVVQPQTRAHYLLHFSVEDKVRLCAWRAADMRNP